ncbi:hypothetical protein [Haloarchaeobius amylolyticus]|uniref:hypothetical protein n=1 Tax=Haloarchaeobius amylolyticus TaxID=1198296 RepID=UPI0022712C88|nr:hypothetical protein [Haloarchaeobius amylolyticus]
MRDVLRSANAVLTWTLVFALLALAGFAYTRDTVVVAGLAAVLAVLAVGPALTRGSPVQVAPWPLVGIACVPLATRAFGPEAVVAAGRTLKLWVLATAPESGLDGLVWTARDARVWVLAVGDRVGVDLSYYLSAEFVAYLLESAANSGFEPVFVFVDAATLAAVALLGVALLQQFTSLRMTASFGRLFVAVATMGLTGWWGIVRWFATDAFGVALVTTNDALMWEFAIASLAGVLVAVLFARYICRTRPEERADTPAPATVATDGGDGGNRPVAETGRASPPAPRVTEYAAGMLVRFMQLTLLTIAYVGYHQQSLGIVVNALGAFAVTFLPAVLGRDRRFTMHVYLTFWLTAAVLFHAAGTLGPYGDIVWYDDLAHTLSASVVAAVGYATARSLEAHSDQLRLTPWFTFVYLLLFVMAAGVLWELLEFAVMFAAERAGQPAPLVQSGLDDTVSDLIYDSIGGVVVALFGSVHLTDTDAEDRRPTDERSA